MTHCKDCKWSEEYFRGLRCYYIYKNGAPKLPAYLRITGYGFAGLDCAYPWDIDQNDYPNCSVFEPKVDTDNPPNPLNFPEEAKETR